jgi:hypothetical protein
MKRTIFLILTFLFGFCTHLYCQDLSAEQSLKNVKIAWEAIFPEKKCILLHKKPSGYETHVYELKHFKSEVVQTNYRVSPYRLAVRIDIEKWSSRVKKMSVQKALDNVEDKGDAVQYSPAAKFPLTAVYKLEDDRWKLSSTNKWMMNFLKNARARYNMHVDISRIISFPEK